ncbi:DUF6443 domain-containing protein [Chryseobacterium sp. BIGb0232]|uniref:DUF6443 domain-containing protein n=1 Tax=Chryseobacterium sp. BIGb0232 TaxID=2940598 RepID=UPI000FA95099|nr:DUF6443 domain-containing protein [Chryseobacterium sp. BIGb0232]MCS4300665.1 RHS repeat-associated protein [Chryseobacterium sp. BIGb0232]ROS20452.1 RHS repeat-associated protein [Chryseobacterium nakagawai]
MKKYLNILGIVLALGYSQAQTLNTTTTENYTYVKNCLDENCVKKTETVQYFDGLGRNTQLVDIAATPSGKDIVTHIEYDDFGRINKEYLPVPQTATQSGAKYTSPLANAPGIYGAEKIYSEKQMESSPLSRVNKVIPIGNDWTSHPVQIEYSANMNGEVKKYAVSNSWSDSATVSAVTENGTYANNQLIKTTVTDGDGNITVEFKNTAGQLILTRKNDGTQNIDTYYVYNDYGQLILVIPPLASVVSLDGTVKDNLCYQYRYDGSGRLVEKKLPGKGWEYMVYDKADRLVLTQDAAMALKGKWFITKYDVLGRVAYTGIVVSTAKRSVLQDLIKDLIITEPRSTQGFTKSGMTVYYVNNYFMVDTESILSVNYYDTYPSGIPAVPTQIMGQNTIKDDLTASLNTKNLPTASYVKNIENDDWTKTWNWYDSKSRVVATNSINHLGGYTKTELELDFIGLTKQSKVYHKRLDTDAEQVITQTFTYDAQNRLLVHKHKINDKPEEILSRNEYNELSQLKNKKVGGIDIANPLQSIDYTYNIQGGLSKINDPANLGSKLFGYEIKYVTPQNPNVAPGKYNGNIAEIDWKNASEGILKRYNYSYDQVNRLRDAVYSEPNSTTPFNNTFNERVTYDMNGNIKTLKRNAIPISGSTTVTQVDDLDYQYTGNRLNQVKEYALNDTGYEGGDNMIDYDSNGNMINMKDKGIQSIVYNHLNLPQRLSIVQTSDFGTYSYSLDYLYRADGTKLRKTYFKQGGRRGETPVAKITDYLDGFQYRYFEGGGICLTCRTESAFEEQAYTNRGTIFPDSDLTPAWKLDFVPTAEGFYSYAENRYIYQYKDHLGNTRVSFAKNSEGALEITDTNNYYPFGMNHIQGSLGTSKFGSHYSYKYNGKELQETGMYDYGARFYMSDIGRWGVVDPLAEISRRFSPYNYGLNNPIMFIDPDGRKALVNDYQAMQAEYTGFIESQGNGVMGQMLSGGGRLSTSFYPGNLGGNTNFGGSATFGQTQAYKDLVSVFANGGEYSLRSHNGYMSWWTGGAEGDANTSQEMVAHMLKLSNSDIPEIKQPSHYLPGQEGFDWGHVGNTMTAGGIAYYALEKSIYSKYHWVDAKGIVKSTKILEKGANGKFVRGVQGLRNGYTAAGKATSAYSIAGKVVGGVGMFVTGYQYLDGQITGTEASVDLAMGAIGFTGWGAPISLAYFGGKFIYEYSTGESLFEKPQKN